jgi:hypothetical protein
MIFVFHGVIKENTMTSMVLQQNSKEIEEVFCKQIYKKQSGNPNDNFNSFGCELYKEILVIKTIHKKIEIEFLDNYSIGTAMNYIIEKMNTISNFSSDEVTFYTKKGKK